MSVPLSAASFLLCYMSQFVIKIRYTGLVNMGGWLNDLSTLLLISTHNCSRAVISPNIKLITKWPPMYSKMSWQGSGKVMSSWAVLHDLGWPQCFLFPRSASTLEFLSSRARADWMKAIYMEQIRPCVLYGRACLEKKKKHVKLGLLQEESVPALGLFLLME